MFDAGPDLSRVALYARYSSPLQSPKSIDDQLRECHAFIKSLGGTVVAEYTDAKRTGETAAPRPGLQSLMAQCRLRKCSAIGVESLDRISRNRTHMSQIYDELEYLGIPILTLQDGPGPVDDIHVGLKSTMNAMFIKDLARKTRRGKLGAVLRGRLNSPLVYGYRIANRIEGKDLIRGQREIDPAQAEIIRRIFRLRADGTSSAGIARILTDDGIPSPRGSARWHAATLTGAPPRVGILRQRLYIGEYVYGARETQRNPLTGRRDTRYLPEDEWTIVEFPHLRIIDDDLWDAVQQRMAEAATRSYRLPAHSSGAAPLTPLLTCPECRGPIRTIARDRWACTNGRRRKCSVTRTFVLRDIESLAAAQLVVWLRRHRKWSRIPDAAKIQLEARRLALEKRIDRTSAAIEHLLDTIETGSVRTRTRTRIAQREGELHRLQNELALLSPGVDIPAIPNLKETLLGLATALRVRVDSPDTKTHHAAAMQLGSLLERIDMSPGHGRAKAWLRVTPDLVALLSWAAENRQDSECRALLPGS